MKPSFPRPGALRGFLPPQAEQRRQRPVYSAAELRAAIEEVARHQPTAITDPGIIDPTGFLIQIAGPITVDAPIIIPGACTGLTIASDYHLISAEGTVASLFDVRATMVTLSRLCLIWDGSSSNYFTALCTLGDAVAQRNRVLDCFGYFDRLFVSDATNTGGGDILRGNQHIEVNASHSAAVVLFGSKGRVVENQLADGGGDSVTIGAGASRCAVIGNDFGGGDYTSSASGGLNTLAANTNVGAITAAGSDNTTGGNTA